MTSKIPTITLTPCRSNPRRYLRMVLYRRVGDRVEPYLAQEVDGRLTVDPIAWRDIRPDYNDVDPEFAEAWAAHVAKQADEIIVL